MNKTILRLSGLIAGFAIFFSQAVTAQILQNVEGKWNMTATFQGYTTTKCGSGGGSFSNSVQDGWLSEITFNNANRTVTVFDGIGDVDAASAFGAYSYSATDKVVTINFVVPPQSRNFDNAGFVVPPGFDHQPAYYKFHGSLNNSETELFLLERTRFQSNVNNTVCATVVTRYKGTRVVD